MIFSSNFFPCIDYFALALKQEQICINLAGQYQKQSYQTRAYVLGPHKVERLNVPVKKHVNHETIGNIRIDYSENWNLKAWKTIQNTYKNSPFFEYYEDYISKVFAKKYDSLVDINFDSLTICLKLLNQKRTICQEQFSYYENKDRFVSFNAKKREENSQEWTGLAYQQVFGNNFEPNLSILDLLFSKGTQSHEILDKIAIIPENNFLNRSIIS